VSVLVDCDIITHVSKGSIVIDPFDRACLGTNSYDVHLADTLHVYDLEFEHVRGTSGNVIRTEEMALDPRVPRATKAIKIPGAGFVLQPGELYLASTTEYTESHEHLPILNGKSSLGRLGLSIHVTAGTGDVGFRGNWTMELFVVKPLRVYKGMAIGQLLWFTTASTPDVPYDLKPSAKYGGRRPEPQASKMYQEHIHVSAEE
jgi:dCTP deaminase